MAELRNLLIFMDVNDRSRVISRYERMFDEAGAAGEDTLLRCFGSPVRQVLLIEQEYREAQAKGETPFADNDRTPLPPAEKKAAEPARPAPPIPAGAPETPAAPAAVTPKTPIVPPSVLQEFTQAPEEAPEEVPKGQLSFFEEQELEEDDLALPPEEDVAPIIPAEKEQILPAEEILPESGEDALLSDPLDFEAPELPLESPPQDQVTEATLPWEEPEEPAVRENDPAGELPEEDYDEDDEEEIDDEDYDEDYDEDDGDEPSAGRKFAAFLITIPMLAVWAVCFGLSLVLGVGVLCAGLAFGWAAMYLMGYVFSGTISLTPDLMLVAGGTLAAAAVALLLIWTGLWVAIGGCAATVRMSGGIYRAVLGRGEED